MGIVTEIKDFDNTSKFWTTPQLVRAQRATERAIQIIVCFIGVYAIAIISYPVKKFIVLQCYRAISYKAKKNPSRSPGFSII